MNYCVNVRDLPEYHKQKEPRVGPKLSKKIIFSMQLSPSAIYYGKGVGPVETLQEKNSA